MNQPLKILMAMAHTLLVCQTYTDDQASFDRSLDGYFDGQFMCINRSVFYSAGTIIGLEYGIAKKATAVAVKVLSRFGSGTFE